MPKNKKFRVTMTVTVPETSNAMTVRHVLAESFEGHVRIHSVSEIADVSMGQPGVQPKSTTEGKLFRKPEPGPAPGDPDFLRGGGA